MKARGEGLLVPLNQFDVSLRPDEPAGLLRVEGHPEELQRWSLRDLSWCDEYAAAVIAEGKDWSLECWNGGV